jgi:integrase
MTREKVRDFEVYLYENYSKKGIGYIITLCSSIFAEELRRDNTVLSKNYFAALTRPKVERQKIRIFSNSELKFIFVNTKSIELRSVFIILLYTGMRPSELINLKYSNISRDHITIVNSKTFKGNRTIPLTSKAREAVKTLSTLTKGKEYLLNGDKPYPDKVLTNRFARKKQYWIKRMPSLSDTSLYDFRHTYGSLLLQAGVNIAVIADLLGHEDIRTTQRWYARLTDADIKEGVMKLEKQFGGLSGDK